MSRYCRVLTLRDEDYLRAVINNRDPPPGSLEAALPAREGGEKGVRKKPAAMQPAPKSDDGKAGPAVSNGRGGGEGAAPLPLEDDHMAERAVRGDSPTLEAYAKRSKFLCISIFARLAAGDGEMLTEREFDGLLLQSPLRLMMDEYSAHLLDAVSPHSIPFKYLPFSI